MADAWSLMHAERAALIEDLEQLSEASWDEPSLCGGWTVQDVAAQVTAL